MANPWMKFYPRDWRGDQALRMVSLAARGLWIECLAVMHEATPYGHLVVNGRPVGDDALARMVGASGDEVRSLLTELHEAGVCDVTGEGVLFSRRMVRDQERAAKGRKAVKKRWAQAAENASQSGRPNRSPKSPPITQKPEARSQSDSAREKIHIRQEDAERLWRAYPEGGKVSASIDGLPLKMGRHVLRLGSVDRLVASAERYAAAVKREDTKPKALDNWLRDAALIDRYAENAGPDIAGEVKLFATDTDDRRRRARWADKVGGPCPDEPGCVAPIEALTAHVYGDKAA